MNILPDWKDKALFTPGPLTTSKRVKQAMLRDLGSRDDEFIEVIRSIRKRLVEEVAGAGTGDYTTVLMQGSGSFGLEAIVSSTVPRGGKLLVIINGAYGRRIARMAEIMGVATRTLTFAEDETPDPALVESVLMSETDITNVAAVHCETTTGIMNPIKEIGQIVNRTSAEYIVDAMSSFGAVPIDLYECHIDYIISSANKCIEGLPGFCFVIAKLERLLETRGRSRSLCLDLLDQYEGFESDGQFRFTPPVQSLLAFEQALDELKAEGGVEARGARYRKNYETLVAGMFNMGFEQFLLPDVCGYIITSFLFHDAENFVFEEFYSRLANKGYVIYSGKVLHAECFRIGNIGRIFESDISALLSAMQETLIEMNVEMPGRFTVEA